jgi:hypothetical protein
VPTLNEPHAELPHVTVHFTPALALSLVTTAARLELVFTISDVGGAILKDTEITGAAAIVIVAEADFVLSVTEVAITFTVAGAGTPDGAA